jgi:hypothetical protein
MKENIMQLKQYFYALILLNLIGIQQSYCMYNQKGSVQNIENGLATKLMVNLIANRLIYEFKIKPKKPFCELVCLENAIMQRPYTKDMFFSPLVIKITSDNSFTDLGVFNPSSHKDLINMIKKNRVLYYRTERGALIYSDYCRPKVQDFRQINEIMKKAKYQL